MARVGVGPGREPSLAVGPLGAMPEWVSLWARWVAVGRMVASCVVSCWSLVSWCLVWLMGSPWGLGSGGVGKRVGVVPL